MIAGGKLFVGRSRETPTVDAGQITVFEFPGVQTNSLQFGKSFADLLPEFPQSAGRKFGPFEASTLPHDSEKLDCDDRFRHELHQRVE